MFYYLHPLQYADLEKVYGVGNVPTVFKKTTASVEEGVEVDGVSIGYFVSEKPA